MLHRAEDWKLLQRAPKLKLEKEYGRSLTLDEEIEKRLIAGAAACNWKKDIFERFRDVVILMRDTGMRNERELYRIPAGAPGLGRPHDLRAGQQDRGRKTYGADERACFQIASRPLRYTNRGMAVSRQAGGKTRHLTTLAERFREARKKAGISPKMVLYCGRHDYGTRIMERTGNLKAEMKVMGHRDVKTAMKHQHPEL